MKRKVDSAWISDLTMEALIKPEVARLVQSLRALGYNTLASELETADWRGNFQGKLINRVYETLNSHEKKG